MPLYEYQCTVCGERVEVIQKMSDPPSTHCPKCGGAMRKLLSSPAIQFKGSGFYKNDYGSGSAAAKREKPTESKSESRGEKPSPE
jgi:putative FmdB family regulatory protein